MAGHLIHSLTGAGGAGAAAGEGKACNLGHGKQPPPPPQARTHLGARLRLCSRADVGATCRVVAAAALYLVRRKLAF